MKRLIFQATLSASVEAGQTIRVFDDGSNNGLPERTVVFNYFLSLMSELQGQLIRERTDHVNAESTGGPAFPAMEVRTADTQDLVANASQGMTLRDWFAGQAMQAILTRKSVNGNELAVYAYQKADAMLAERIAARPSMAQVAKNKILQLREQGFTDYPVVATLQNGMHVCTVDNFGAVCWFSSEDTAHASK